MRPSAAGADPVMAMDQCGMMGSVRSRPAAVPVRAEEPSSGRAAFILDAHGDCRGRAGSTRRTVTPNEAGDVEGGRWIEQASSYSSKQFEPMEVSDGQ